MTMICSLMRPVRLAPSSVYLLPYQTKIIGKLNRQASILIGNMTNQEGRKPLKSLNSDTPTHVKFMNKSRREVTAWWLNFSGIPVSYGNIQPGEFLQMNTFLTHPWVFRTPDGYAKLLADRKEVYFPTLTEYEYGFPVYKDVMITSPVYTLQEYCCMLIRKRVKREDFDKLDIAECLKNDLTKTPNLRKELQILSLSTIQ